MNKLRSARQRGVTLYELLVALAVVAISASVAVPSFQAVVSTNRQASAVNSLVSTLHSARSEAITRNQQITVCPSLDGANCGGNWSNGWIWFADLDRDRNVDPNDVLIGASPAPRKLNVASGEFGGFLAYRPNGRIMVNNVDQDTGRFALCDWRGDEHVRLVEVNQNGRPGITTPGPGETGICPAEPA